jgi:Protein of unknown function (DUF2637)/Lsr2
MKKADQVAAGVVMGIAAGAFTLSYEALRGVYMGTSGNVRLSVIYPLIVEGFVTVAVWVAFRLRDFGWKATAYPWTLAGMFFAYSLWSNSLPATVPAPVVLGMPSLAVPLAVHLFTHMVKKREPVAAVALAELVAEDEAEEALSDAPWVEWELPETAEQAPIFEAPRSRVAVAAAHSSTNSAATLIRAWGRRNGFDVKDTGRIPEGVVQAYAKAHTA